MIEPEENPEPDQPQMTDFLQADAQSIHAQLVRMRQSSAGEVAADEVSMQQSAAGRMSADKVTLQQSAAGFIKADHVSLNQASAGLKSNNGHSEIFLSHLNNFRVKFIPIDRNVSIDRGHLTRSGSSGKSHDGNTFNI